MEISSPDRSRAATAWLCVLASGSGGNCSALVLESPAGRHLYLIDLGLSPRRTRRDLAIVGLSLNDLRGVLLTHLDTDHWNPAWVGVLPPDVTLMVHRRHAGRGARNGALYQRTHVLDGPAELEGGAVVHTAIHAHDELGVSVFRIELTGCGRTLGYATDVGRVTPALIEHLAGVDVLAIESNYCPEMQAASDRPAYLKRRIMGGSGHLSNAQCAGAVEQIRPRERVVLLHLSRQCNRPELALREHEGRPYQVTISSQVSPTDPIPVSWEGAEPRPSRRFQSTLFG